jgi:hypothetical protein
MAETLATEAWLLWRLGKDGRPEHLGIFKSREVAEENRAVLWGQRWQVCGPVQLLGWGFIAETGRTLSNASVICSSYKLH